MKGMNRISLTAGLCVLASQCLAGSEGGNRNILLIMADDMGAMELGCYGNEINRTPNIDRLAEEGMMFSTFFATPVSTPSRVALMTGKYGIHTGHLNMSNLPGGRGRGYDLSTDEYTFGQMFSDAGYSTVLAGKWQLSGKGETLIKECGFDEYMAWIYKDNLAEGVVYRGGYFPEGTTKTSRYWYPGIMTNGKHIGTSPEDYGPDMYSAFLMDFIRRQVKEDKPFFAYYPMTLVHAPWQGTPDFPDRKVNSPEAFKANVEYCDKIVGRLIAGLDELGVSENTLVIFIGDNGTQGRGKTTVTEWGPRTPCIIRCPGTVRDNVVSNALVDIPDILATMLDYAGFRPWNCEDLDGKSFMPVLEGQTEEHEKFAISYYGNFRIVRSAEWLLEGNSDESPGILYWCGDRRNGLGYEKADMSASEARKAMREFLDYIDSSKPEYKMTEEDKAEFKEFVMKNGKRLEKNIISRYGSGYW